MSLIENVYVLFGNTLSADSATRKHAEDTLKQNECTPNFAWNLLQLLAHPPPSAPSHEVSAIQQAAAIYFKNLTLRHWPEEKESKDEENGDDIENGDDEEDDDEDDDDDVDFPQQDSSMPHYSISATEKAMIREHLIPIFLTLPERLRSQLIPALSTIIRHDFPKDYPMLVDQLHLAFQQLQHLQQMDALGACLTILYTVVKRYQFVRASQREPLEKLFTVFFPFLHDLALRLLASPTPMTSGFSIKMICKIYFSSIQMDFPPSLMATLESWMSVFMAILNHPISTVDEMQYFVDVLHTQPSPEDSQDELAEQRSRYPWWKAKKWVSHLALRIMQRYCHPASSDHKYKSLATWFIDHQVAPLLASYLAMLNKTFDTSHTNHQVLDERFIAPKVLYYMLYFFGELTQRAKTWQMLQPVMLKITTHVIFPLLQHSQSDALLWKEEPIAFVQKKFDMMQDFRSTVSAAKNCLVEVMENRKKSLLTPVLQFVQLKLSLTAPDEASAQRALALDKDGALAMLGCLKSSLIKNRTLRRELAGMIQHTVVKELSSPFPFLRARACWMIETYADVLQSEESVSSSESLLLVHLIQCVVHLMGSDSELPVRIYASLALGALLNEHQPVVKQQLVHILPNVLELLLHLANETNLEDLASVIRDILFYFSEQLAPYAVQICTNLRDMFLKIEMDALTRAKNRNGDDDENENEEEGLSLSSYGLLRGILTMLYALEKSKEILVALESVLLPMFLAILKYELVDCYDDLFSMVSVYCYHLKEQCPPTMIQTLLPEIHRAVVVDKTALDLFTDLYEALEYMIKYCNPLLMSSGLQYLIIQMVDKVIQEKDSIGEENANAACQLMETTWLMHADWLNAQWMGLACQAHKRAKTKALKSQAMLAILAGLYADPVQASLLLDGVGAKNKKMNGYQSSAFLRLVLEQHRSLLKRVHDKKLVIFAFLKLYLVGVVNGNEGLRQVVLQSFPVILTLFQGLPDAYKRREQYRLELAAEEGDEEEEEGEGQEETSVERGKERGHLDEKNKEETEDESDISDREDVYGDRDRRSRGHGDQDAGEDEDAMDDPSDSEEWGEDEDADEDEDGDEDWDELEEDFDRETVIDEINEYEQFMQVMSDLLPRSNPGVYQTVIKLVNESALLQQQIRTIESEGEKRKKQKDSTKNK